MLSFLQRLKQRKIVQWAIGYFAGAWLALEVFNLIAEQFLWPTWIRQASTVLVLFGGLITIVLAWYHGERGRQKVGAMELVILVAILALGGQSVWLLKDRNDRLESEAGGQVFRFREMPLPEHSVAVLPCVNLGSDESQGYFADGLAAELITRMAAVGGLRIPSHTSSFAFRGKNVTIEAVAAALKVRHVLECDAFGDESHLRISARLIDAGTGYTLWSETFNRARAMMLEVQEEVAMAVVRNLEIQLVDRERLLLGRRWTASPRPTMNSSRASSRSWMLPMKPVLAHRSDTCSEPWNSTRISAAPTPASPYTG
jgi:TolB-like protein